MFLQYHFDLVDRNMTTIEHLDEKRGNIKDYNYDMGKEWNWQSVFGKKKACYYLPLDEGEAAPHGDGTVFMKQTLVDKKSDHEEEAYYEDNNYDNDNWDDDSQFADPLNNKHREISAKRNPLQQNFNNELL